MMKYYLCLILLCFFCSCNENVHSFTSIKDVVEIGKSENKSSVICLYDDNDDILKGNKFQGHFLIYNVEDIFETEIGKIIQPDVLPLYLYVKEDSIHAVLEADEWDLLQDVINDIPVGEYKYRTKMKYINEILKLYNHNIYGDSILSSNILDLESLIRNENMFYGKFLLAKLYSRLDKDKAYELYQDLWNNSTSDEVKLYPSEFIEIMGEKDKVVCINTEDIQFDYLSFDFGYVHVHDEVMCKFYYVNKSKLNFIIYSVTSTCGCTIPSWSKKPLKPGEKDSIIVKLKANERSNILKTVKIYGNSDSIISLKVKATII